MKIEKKISISFLITALIILFCSAPVFYREARRNLKTAIYSNLLTTLQSRATHIETVLNDYRQNCKMVASGNAFRDAVDANKELDQVNRRIASMIQSHDDICRIRALDADGRIIASSHDDVGADMGNDEAFLKGKQGVFIKDLRFCRRTGSFSLPVAAPIMVDGVCSGVLVIYYKAGQLFGITTDNTGLGETGEIYIVNNKGYMASPSRFLKDSVLKQKVDTENSRDCFSHMTQPGIPHEEVKVFKDYRGIDCLGAHILFPELKWGLVAEIDEKEALAPLRRIRTLFILLMAFIPIIVWLIGHIVSKRITSPIVRLLEATRIIGKGDLAHRVGTDAKDEIGELSRAFDQMTGDLKESATSISNLNREIAERKRAEAALSESERKYRSLVETLPAVTYLAATDEASTTLYVSPQIMDFIGCSQEEYRADPNIWGKMLHPDDHDRVMKEVEESHRNNKPFVSEYRMIAKGGSTLWLRDEATIVCDDEGTPLFLQGIMLDITEKKLTEQILKESEEKYRSIFDQARDGIVLLDTETGCIVDCNAEFESQTGTDKEKLKNMKIWDVRPPDKRDAAKKKFFEIKKQGSGGCSDLEFQKPNGDRVPVEFVTRIIKIQGRQYLQSIVRDTTERKKYEEEIRKFKTISDRANYGTLICDINGNIVYINKYFASGHGYTIEEVMGKNISIFHTAEQFQKVKYLTIDLRRDLEFSAQEVRHLHKKGFTFPMLMNAVSIMDKNGKAQFIATTAIDITELKQAEDDREKLIKKLQKALAEITQLSGMLPICASCKKIRDDKGYWHQVESYIRDHAGVEFTHGLCPDCVKKYWPDMPAEIPDKSDKKEKVKK